MAGAVARPRGLAKGGGGAGQQERAHRLGAARQRARVRSELRVGQAWRSAADTGPGAGLNAFPDEQVLPVDVRSKMQFTGQTGSRQARLTGCRANCGDGGE